MHVSYSQPQPLQQAAVGTALRRYHDNQNLLGRLVDHLAQYGYHDTATKPPVDPLDALPEAASSPQPSQEPVVTLLPTPAGSACSTPKVFDAPVQPSPVAEPTPEVTQPNRPLHALAYKTPAVARLRDATPASTASSGNIALTPGMQYVLNRCMMMQP